MKSRLVKPEIKAGFGFTILLLLLGLAYWADSPDKAGSWYSILPALLAITLAFVTGNLFLSLITAVVAGALLVQVPADPGAVGSYGEAVVYMALLAWESLADKNNLMILGFVTFILSMLSVVLASGGFHAFMGFMSRWIRGPKSAQLATYFLGLLLFIDDYANTMVVGTTMREITDRYKISREKLAFLVDATSAPIAGLAIVSTWIGYEVGLFQEIANKYGLPLDGYAIFFEALPFRFYCGMMLLFVFALLVWDLDFGPMRRADRRARETGHVIDPNSRPLTAKTFEKAVMSPGVRPSLWLSLFPIGLLIGLIFAGLYIDGGGLAGPALGFLSPARWNEVIRQSENSIFILLVSSFVVSIVVVSLAILVSKNQPRNVAMAYFKGFKSSALPVAILILAWSLKTICENLETGPFLTGLMQGQVSPVFLPAMVFVIAALTAFATGTSWGTMAILIPTVAPVALEMGGGSLPMLVMCLAAILDGAIFGDHASPISDTTIMSSIASECDLMDHVRTQLPYALLIGTFALLGGYIPAALGLAPGLVWSIFAISLVGCGLSVRYLFRKAVPRAV